MAYLVSCSEFPTCRIFLSCKTVNESLISPFFLNLSISCSFFFYLKKWCEYGSHLNAILSNMSSNITSILASSVYSFLAKVQFLKKASSHVWYENTRCKICKQNSLISLLKRSDVLNFIVHRLTLKNWLEMRITIA